MGKKRKNIVKNIAVSATLAASMTAVFAGLYGAVKLKETMQFSDPGSPAPQNDTAVTKVLLESLCVSSSDDSLFNELSEATTGSGEKRYCLN